MHHVSFFDYTTILEQRYSQRASFIDPKNELLDHFSDQVIHFLDQGTSTVAVILVIGLLYSLVVEP